MLPSTLVLLTACLATSAHSAISKPAQTRLGLARLNVTSAKFDGACYYPVPAADFVLDDYLGTWFEVAGTPQPFLDGCSCITARYTLNSNGTVNVLNSCVRGGRTTNILGLATPVDEQYTQGRGDGGAFKVTFLGLPEDKDECPGPNYVVQKQGAEWAIVQSSNFSGLFLLSRERAPNDRDVQKWLDEAGSRGSDVTNVVRFETKDCPSTWADNVVMFGL